MVSQRQAIEAEKKAREEQEQQAQQQQSSISMAEQDRATQMLRDRLEQLRRLPPLHFTRRARGAAPPSGVPDQRAIFGSVSVDDVLLRLREAHQLVVERSWIQLATTHAEGSDGGSSSQDRVRQLGGARFQVQIPGVGTSMLRVMVAPEEIPGTEEEARSSSKAAVAEEAS
ncbi:hypothetical protein SYNPS1DRAFT_26304 [Syncephalis pseudoplumigaleata]|uniref:Ribosomal protein L9 C-terminal domain-containing protein n=1 Tax=Syncephalis pseudoplumigaleata TaxID=1712513 RepID=A0A4P9Z8L8_9FUNG|nr:hypothetical protein SYNPS1DRAFT_26304 [Syncephalis pseudoplumigaleata]|eukprot:RKP28090.1 hypothetical protein SYNPS1DRAFT_26304 [Syncephalis pseudoplumigaleata]